MRTTTTGFGFVSPLKPSGERFLDTGRPAGSLFPTSVGTKHAVKPGGR